MEKHVSPTLWFPSAQLHENHILIISPHQYVGLPTNSFPSDFRPQHGYRGHAVNKLTWLNGIICHIMSSSYPSFSSLAQQPNADHGRLTLEVSRSHTMTHHSSRTPLDEWSARRRDLYLTRHNTHKRDTSRPPAGFEPAIPASERLQTLASFRWDRPCVLLRSYNRYDCR
jgi:hypothetical protein